MRRRRMMASTTCGSGQNETCDFACGLSSCGYVKTTTYWNESTWDASSCEENPTDGALFTESAKAINICENGLLYDCNATHAMTYTFDNDECSGDAQSVSITSNELQCHGGYAVKNECFAAGEDESAAENAINLSLFVYVSSAL